MQTTGQGAFKTRTLRPERSSHAPFSSSFWRMGSVMWDIEEENEEVLCPTVQMKEVIDCIVSWSGKGTDWKKIHIIKRHLNTKVKENPWCSLFPFCKFPQVPLDFYIRCKRKKIHCSYYGSVAWKRKMHRPLTPSVIFKLLGLFYWCGRKHQHPNSTQKHSALH